MEKKDLTLMYAICDELLLCLLRWLSVGVCRRVLDSHWSNEALCFCFVFLSLQIFDEEYAVLYLNQGGALVAIRHTPLPIRHLWWVIMTEMPFVTAWLIPSEEAPSLKLVKQRQMSLSSNCRDNIILVRKAASHRKICFDNYHSLSPFCVQSRNESSFHWSLFARQSASALHWKWNQVVRQFSGSLACAHSRGISAGLRCNSCLCSQVELRRGAAVEQVHLHQHTSVCGRRAGRARGGDAHHDVSDNQFVSMEIYQSRGEIKQLKASACVCVWVFGCSCCTSLLLLL